MKDLNNIGLSTFLYFETLLNLIFLLMIAFLVYGVYSLITNIMAANNYRSNILFEDVLPDNENSYQGFLVLSLGSKQLHGRDLDKKYY